VFGSGFEEVVFAVERPAEDETTNLPTDSGRYQVELDAKNPLLRVLLRFCRPIRKVQPNNKQQDI
jgi:hypothetical protein